jgi:Heavy metal associated domain 2
MSEAQASVANEEHSPLSATVAHVTRGRVRFKVRGARAQQQALQSAQHRIKSFTGVHDVEIRPETGSIVVHHTDEPEFLRDLLKLVADSRIILLEIPFDPNSSSQSMPVTERDPQELAGESKAAKAVLSYSEKLNGIVKQATGGWMDLPVLLPTIAGVCALLFIEVETAPLWVPLALFSVDSFSNLPQRESARSAVAL